MAEVKHVRQQRNVSDGWNRAGAISLAYGALMSIDKKGSVKTAWCIQEQSPCYSSVMG